MRRFRTTTATMATLAGLFLAGATANAEALAATSDDVGTGWATLAENELDAERGGADVVTVQESKSDSTVSDNSVGDGVLTGTIHFEGSFHDNSGIQSSMINSGNNVSMQSSMTVNVYLD